MKGWKKLRLLIDDPSPVRFTSVDYLPDEAVEAHGWVENLVRVFMSSDVSDEAKVEGVLNVLGSVKAGGFWDGFRRAAGSPALGEKRLREIFAEKVEARQGGLRRDVDVCDQCGRKVTGEQRFMVSVNGDVVQVCCIECYERDGIVPSVEVGKRSFQAELGCPPTSPVPPDGGGKEK